MRRTICVLSVLVAFWIGPVSANQVVEFTDGRYLEIRSHAIEGEFIRLVVDEGAVLSFPSAQVERIRDGWSVIYDDDSTADRKRRNESIDLDHGAEPDLARVHVPVGVGRTL